MKSCCPVGWIKFFKAIADGHRQRILSLIKHHPDINASKIIKLVGLSQPTISHHLKILEEANLIIPKKSGKEVFYSINEKTVLSCCGGFSDKFSH